MTSVSDDIQIPTPSSPSKPPRRPPPSVAPKPKVQFAKRPEYIAVKEIQVDTFYVPERDYPRPAAPPTIVVSSPSRPEPPQSIIVSSPSSPSAAPLATINEAMEEVKLVRYDQNQNYIENSNDIAVVNSEVPQNIPSNTQIEEEDIPPPPTFPPPPPPLSPDVPSTQHVEQASEENNPTAQETYQSQQTVINIIRNKNSVPSGNADTPRFTSSGRYLQRQSSVSSTSSMVTQTGAVNKISDPTVTTNPSTVNGQNVRYVYEVQDQASVPVQESAPKQRTQSIKRNETPLLNTVNTPAPIQVAQNYNSSAPGPSRDSFTSQSNVYTHMASIPNPAVREEYQDMQQVRVFTTNPTNAPSTVNIAQQPRTSIVTTAPLPRQVPVAQHQPITVRVDTHGRPHILNPPNIVPVAQTSGVNVAHTRSIPVTVSQRQPPLSIRQDGQPRTLVSQTPARQYYVPVSNEFSNISRDEFVPLMRREPTPVYLQDPIYPQQVAQEINHLPNRSIYYIDRLEEQNQPLPMPVQDNYLDRHIQERYISSTDKLFLERPIRQVRPVERKMVRENQQEPVLLWKARHNQLNTQNRSLPASNRQYYPQYVLDNEVQHPINIGHTFDTVDDLEWNNWIHRQEWPSELDQKDLFSVGRGVSDINWHTATPFQPIPSVFLPSSAPEQYSPPSPLVKTDSPFPFVQNGSNVQEIEVTDTESEEGRSSGSIPVVVFMFFVLALVVIAAATALVITYINGIPDRCADVEGSCPVPTEYVLGFAILSAVTVAIIIVLTYWCIVRARKRQTKTKHNDNNATA